MKPPTLFRAGLVLVAMACLAACGILNSKAPREQLYALRPAVAAPAATAAATPAAATAATGAAAIRLQIMRAAALPGLESARVMLAYADGRLDYFAGGRWPGTLPQVFGGMIGDTLRASGDYADVQDDRSGFGGDYVLSMSVRHFEAQYAASGPAEGGTPDAYVAVDCTLASRDRRVLTTFRAESRVSAGGGRLGQVVAALERAAQDTAGTIRTRVTEALNQANAQPRARD